MAGIKKDKQEAMEKVEREIKMRSVDFFMRNNYVACVVIDKSKTDTIVLPENVMPTEKPNADLYVLAVPPGIEDLKPGDRIRSALTDKGCLSMPDKEYGMILLLEQHRIIAVDKRSE